MDEIEEQIYIHILNQTLVDNTIMISHAGIADTYQIPLDVVSRTIQGLIDNGYIMRLREGYYSVKFDKLDQVK